MLSLCVNAAGSPKGVEFNSVKEVLLSVKAVKSMHSLHLWALTLGQALVSVHVAIGETTQPCATYTHTHTPAHRRGLTRIFLLWYLYFFLERAERRRR